MGWMTVERVKMEWVMNSMWARVWNSAKAWRSAKAWAWAWDRRLAMTMRIVTMRIVTMRIVTTKIVTTMALLIATALGSVHLSNS
jgi:hypothetical protein